MGEASDSELIETRHGPMWALKGDSYITECLRTYGEYCKAEADLFGQLVRPGMTVVEAGANIGTHSVMLARACAPGRLLAFEPQQRVFQLLCANLAINDITNASAFPEALGAAAGIADMPETDYGRTGNFGRVSPKAGSGAGAWAEGRSVRVAPLDALELSSCHLIKIDVEGWEAEVLRGARATISRCGPLIYAENDRADQQAEIIALIDQLGYDQYWHVAPLYAPDNFRGATRDVTGAVASLNMLCVPRESGLTVTGFEKIDPQNWRSPLKPIGA